MSALSSGFSPRGVLSLSATTTTKVTTDLKYCSLIAPYSIYIYSVQYVEAVSKNMQVVTLIYV